MCLNRKMLLVLLLVALISLLCSCSSMQTYSNFKDPQSIINNQSYQIRVRTGNEVMDRIVYEFAYIEFSKHLPVAEKGVFTGTIDIVFSSVSDSNFVGVSNAYTTSSGYTNGWYTGAGQIYLNGRNSAITNTVSAGTGFTWQNSTMLVILKDTYGKRLWSADYQYKGGMELSGFSVNTPEEAARLCIQRVADRMKDDLS